MTNFSDHFTTEHNQVTGIDVEVSQEQSHAVLDGIGPQGLLRYLSGQRIHRAPSDIPEVAFYPDVYLSPGTDRLIVWFDIIRPTDPVRLAATTRFVWQRDPDDPIIAAVMEKLRNPEDAPEDEPPGVHEKPLDALLAAAGVGEPPGVHENPSPNFPTATAAAATQEPA